MSILEYVGWFVVPLGRRWDGQSVLMFGTSYFSKGDDGKSKMQKRLERFTD